jgi:uncharacterized membrane protein
MTASWLVGLAVLIAIGLLLKAAQGPGPTAADDPPEVILKRRYARREIDAEEYQCRLTDLRK